eukprot:TRINITY_DN1749_c0_g1_i1.p1 TRINITY_DN1749_c0_g1~~TRINITY_DN1749_c0_g1_i1.p1  ORF type:complete len:242 (-),score=49.73 TRINITY_DN1749_c0_g1_i1:106-831(-)
MKLFGILSIFLLLTAAVFANEDTEVETAEAETEQEMLITSARDVLVSGLFPRHSDARIPTGKYSEILLGFTNAGRKLYNVTAIQASLRYSLDPSMFVQNFSAWRYSTIVRPGEQFAFSYQFYPEELLEARDYALVANVFYNDEDGTVFASTFYNGTVYLVEELTPLDFQTVFATLLALGMGAGLFYFGLKSTGADKKVLGSSTKTTPSEAVNDRSYLEDSNLGTWNSKKAGSPKRSPARKN